MEADSSSRCGPTPASSVTFAVAPPPTSDLPSLSTDGGRCKPEAGVGILSAVTDPAAERLRIVEPVRSVARVILEATPGLSCRGFNCTISRCSSRRPFRATEQLLSCNLCRRVYVYKGEMGLCKAECRYDFVSQELRRRRDEAAAAKRARRRRAAAPWANEGGCMFFTCVEIP